MEAVDNGPAQRLLDVREAAKVTRLSRPTIYRLMASGQLESVKIGGLRRIPVECIDDFVARLRAEQASA